MSSQLSGLPEHIRQQISEIARQAGGPLLAVDTSSAITSWCLADATDCDEQHLPAGVVPSESLVQSLDAGFRARQINASMLKCVVLGIGPGSFTGLRVGLATIKGLAFGADIPVIGVSSLACWAASVLPETPSHPVDALVVLDARRGDVFAGGYRVNVDGGVHAWLEDGVYTPSLLQTIEHIQFSVRNAHAILCVGDGTVASKDTAAHLGITFLDAMPLRAAYGFIHAAERLKNCDWDDLQTLAPRYLRVSEAERQLGSMASSGSSPARG